MDHSRDMRSYMEALEEERRKIQVFHRELPLCMELVTQAIDACTKQLATKECKEFIPIRKVSTSSDHTDDEVVDADDDDELHSHAHSHSHSPSSIDDDEKKSDWLRSVSLWNPNPDNIPIDHQVGTTAAKSDASWLERAASPPGSTTTSSAAGGGGVNRSDGPATRKQRRCWSPELHRRFVHALQQLGGSHAATPKQIRDLMKVDGLTNDEVKSHLQKYRLHTRRPSPSAAVAAPSPQQPQFVVVGGIWAPPPPPRAAIHHHHVAASATSSRIAAANRRYVTLPFPAAPPQQIRRKGEASEETRTANPAKGSNSAADSSSTTHTISAC